MAEALAIVGSVGAICGLVAGIGKVILLITDLNARWEGADLTLLSLASQLTALRAAITKIQEWTDRGLQDAHHQLIMDLDISIKCCRLLINKVESFFSDLASLTGKPLDLRQKYKVAFGSAGPEGIQKLIERQTSALTLLLTACNCTTLSEQHRHLETTKTRKVLKRAQADSISLCVQRDTASFASKMTDNLSKISRIFEFDQNIFSTRVYERAFRGSVKSALRQQQVAAPAGQRAPYERIYLLGDDEAGKDLLINALYPTHTEDYTEDWMLYRLQMQQLCVDLISTIIKRGTPDWDAQHISVLLSYSKGPHEARPSFSDALEACAILWWSSLRRLHEPDPDPQGYLREKIEFKNMVFHVDIIPAGGLNIYCGNIMARFFFDQMEHILPIRTTQPRYAIPSTADFLRAKALSHPTHTFECRLQTGATSICLIGTSAKDTKVWPSFQDLQSALSIAFVFDLRDYGDGTSSLLSEMQARLCSSLADLASLENRGPPSDLPFMLLFSNAKSFKGQIKKLRYTLIDESVTNDYDTAISDISARFHHVLRLPLTINILDIQEDSAPTDLINILQYIGNGRNGLRAITEIDESS